MEFDKEKGEKVENEVEVEDTRVAMGISICMRRSQYGHWRGHGRVVG